MKIAVLTLGCKLNYAESSTYIREFRKAGCEIVAPGPEADVFVVNTCSVTSVSDRKSRNLLRRVHRMNPKAVVVAVGCSAELRKEELSALDGVSLVIGAGEKSLLVEKTLALCGILYNGAILQTSQDCMSCADNIFPAFSTGERTRSFLKVQDGCNNFCAYCTVPYARGRSRNAPIEECVANAEKIAAEGTKEIVLTGVNTGDFGHSTSESFLDLLRRLDKVEGIERYRISSIEPNLLSHEIVDWIASGTKFVPHFHIPLQSGSDEILRAMGRRYSCEQLAELISYIRKAMEHDGGPKVFFGIDLMCGLPGETDELFERSYNFIESLHPAFIHVFPYSRRPGTRAANMPGQVREEVKHERVARIEALCARLHSEFVAANRGVHERVLFESTDHNGMMEGYSGNYIRVSRPYDEALIGKLVDVVL